MKTKHWMSEWGGGRGTVGGLVAGVAVAGFLAGELAGQEGEALPDLPYASASTGADGDLVIATPRYLGPVVYDPDGGGVVVGPGYYWSQSVQLEVRDTFRFSGDQWERLDKESELVSRWSRFAFDEARQQVVSFGGPNQGEYVNVTATLGDNGWEAVEVASAPPARTSHMMAYDSENEVILLFGGSDGTDALGDLWSWDGAVWTEIESEGGPPGRWSAAVAYDRERKKLVIFGGRNADTTFADTWEWDSVSGEWADVSPASSPGARYMSAMAYDRVRQEVVMYGGYSLTGTYYFDTWTWRGSAWSGGSTHGGSGDVSARRQHALVFDEGRGAVVLVGGYNRYGNNDLRTPGTMWAWDGSSDWERVYNPDTSHTIDLAGSPDGVFHYGEIHIPAGVTVGFERAAGNPPVTWLATGNVRIAGTVDLTGANGGWGAIHPGQEALPGPGGYAGGLGGTRFDSSGSYAGTAGLGPGGGLPGTEWGGTDASNNHYGKDGRHRSVYGSAYVQPLTGGSGGGGSSSLPNVHGTGGGAGGGAILIDSSRDVTISGSINVNGGNRYNGQYINSLYRYRSGHGSAGSIRIVGDRVLGGGSLTASGPGESGWVRIEGYYRELTGGSISPAPQVSMPVRALDVPAVGGLKIASIAGEPVPEPPGGSLVSPDVVFSEAGEITVVVASDGVVPDGSPVTLRVTTAEGIIDQPADGEDEVFLAGGSASFTVTVPAGYGTVQAFARYTETVVP